MPPRIGRALVLNLCDLDALREKSRRLPLRLILYRFMTYLLGVVVTAHTAYHRTPRTP